MTQGQGEMRETYPETGEAFRYRIDEEEGYFTFYVDGDHEGERAGGAGQGPRAAVSFNIESTIESRETGEGLCRSSTTSGQPGRTHAFAWAWAGAELHLWVDGDLFVFQRADPSTSSRRRRSNVVAAEAPTDVLAPMPGAVLEVLVGEGDRVERNQTVAIVESMKMELVITASRSGIVRRVSVIPGQQVERGMRLLELAPESDTGTGSGE